MNGLFFTTINMKKLIAFICGLVLIVACSKNNQQQEKFDQTAYSLLEGNIDSLIGIIHTLEVTKDKNELKKSFQQAGKAIKKSNHSSSITIKD